MEEKGRREGRRKQLLRSQSVENSLWKVLWILRKTDYGTKSGYGFIRSLAGARDICRLQSVKSGSGPNPGCCSFCLGGYFSRREATWLLSWPFTSTQYRSLKWAEIVSTPHPPRLFVLCTQTKYRDRTSTQPLTRDYVGRQFVSL